MTPWWEPVDVSDWPERQVEATGSTSARWLEDPATSDIWLHKDTRIPATLLEQGEDWAEAVATQVGHALGVPCAEVRLCVRSGRRGSLSRRIHADGHSFWTGNVWLNGRVPGYLPQTEGAPAFDPERPGVRRPGHTVENFRSALSQTVPPSGFRGNADNGFDVFAGFLVLDAIVANRDRHTENWAVLEPQVGDGPTILAPSFDHGGCLGYNEKDDVRRRALAARSRLDRWVQRGTAHRLEHTRGQVPSLMEVAVAGLDLAGVGARDWWCRQVQQLDLAPVVGALQEGRIGSMSVPARMFAAELLTLNVGRLRDVIGTGD